MRPSKRMLGLFAGSGVLAMGLAGCGASRAAATHGVPSAPAHQAAPAKALPRPRVATPTLTPLASSAPRWLPNHQQVGAQAITTYVSPQVGWQVLRASPVTIRVTTDGGHRWHTLTTWPAASGTITGLSFTSNQQGWLATHAPSSRRTILYHTQTGGKSWTAVALSGKSGASLPTGMTAFAPFWINPQDGVLVARAGQANQVPGPGMWLWVTDNGGASWQSEPASGPGHLGSFQWRVPYQGTVEVVQHGVVWKSTTYGATWSPT